ncbi:hypothetical protein, partial [Pseudomonas sp. GD04015]
NRQSMPIIEVTLATLQLDALARLGRHAELLRRAEQAVGVAHQRSDLYLLPETLRLQADALFASDAPARALAQLDEAEALAERFGAGALSLRLAATRQHWQPSPQAETRLEEMRSRYGEQEAAQA